jgi:hypothetical protein
MMLCVVAGLAFPAAQQNISDLQRLNYTLITKYYVIALSYLTMLLFAAIIQRR